MWWIATVLAGPANGDFESGLAGWNEVSGAPATVTLATEGEEFSVIGNATGALLFPSSSEAALLRGGPGTALQVASMETTPYVNTHETLTLSYYNESELTVAYVVGFIDGTSSIGITNLDAAPGSWASVDIDVAAHCGLELVVRLNQTADVEQGFTLFDDIGGVALCDGFSDGDGDGQCEYGTDTDNDGACASPGEASLPGADPLDCDDADPTIFSGATEIPNDGIDQDCDGDDLGTGCFVDADGDGFGHGPSGGPPDCVAPGISAVDGDCDDTRGDVNPSQPEFCDGIDTDCDGSGDGPAVTAFPDADGDGYGDDAAMIQLCGPLGDYLEIGGDCDDQAAGIHPTADEIPADEVDQNCDGLEDCYADLDMDGYAGLTLVSSPSLQCAGGFDSAEDCDDTDFLISPGAGEDCDGVDTDCDGELDNGLPQFPFYLDIDGDGYGQELRSACASPGPDYTQVPGDCDESDAAVNPGAVEVAIDGIDQDCDGGDTCHRDADRDGYGTPTLVDSPDLTCDDPGESLTADDCDDQNISIFPDANEIPDNGIDENCDGVDDSLIDTDDVTVTLRGGAACSTGVAPTPWLGAFLQRR